MLLPPPPPPLPRAPTNPRRQPPHQQHPAGPPPASSPSYAATTSDLSETSCKSSYSGDCLCNYLLPRRPRKPYRPRDTAAATAVCGRRGSPTEDTHEETSSILMMWQQPPGLLEPEGCGDFCRRWKHRRRQGERRCQRSRHVGIARIPLLLSGGGSSCFFLCRSGGRQQHTPRPLPGQPPQARQLRATVHELNAAAAISRGRCQRCGHHSLVLVRVQRARGVHQPTADLQPSEPLP